MDIFLNLILNGSNIIGIIDNRSFDCFRFNISEETPLYIGDAIISSSAINAELRNQEIERLHSLHDEKKTR